MRSSCVRLAEKLARHVARISSCERADSFARVRPALPVGHPPKNIPCPGAARREATFSTPWHTERRFAKTPRDEHAFELGENCGIDGGSPLKNVAPSGRDSEPRLEPPLIDVPNAPAVPSISAPFCGRDALRSSGAGQKRPKADDKSEVRAPSRGRRAMQ